MKDIESYRVVQLAEGVTKWAHAHVPTGPVIVHTWDEPCHVMKIRPVLTSISGEEGATHQDPPFVVPEPVKHIIHEKKTRPRSWFEKAEPYHIAVLTENAVDLLLGAAADIGTPDISTLHVGVYEVKDKPGMLELKAWVEVTER